MNRMMTLATLLGIATFVACGVENKGTAPAKSAVKVTVAKAEVAEMASAESYAGTVRSRQSVVISTKMMGRVLRLAVSEGETVKKGQLLVEVDAAEAQSAYRQSSAGLEAAEVAVANAERDLARFRALYEQKAVTKHQLEQVEMGVASAKAQRAQAQAGQGMSTTLLSYGKIVAPHEGVITRKWMDAGNLAYPGAPILTLENPSDLEVALAVPEERARLLAAGQQASGEVDGLSASLSATVTSVVPAADPMSRTSSVVLSLPANGGARPGQYAKVRFAAFARPALSVPATAVVERGQMDGLFVVEGGIARLRFIQAGLRSGNRAEILAGVMAGEEVVSPVPETLTDGTPVEVAR